MNDQPQASPGPVWHPVGSTRVMVHAAAQRALVQVAGCGICTLLRWPGPTPNRRGQRRTVRVILQSGAYLTVPTSAVLCWRDRNDPPALVPAEDPLIRRDRPAALQERREHLAAEPQCPACGWERGHDPEQPCHPEHPDWKYP